MIHAALVILFSLGATPYGDVFAQAQRAFDAGDYAAAAKAYEQVIATDSVSPELFYNTGNAYFRAGRLGPAIANYERALQLRPGYRAARENLEHALEQTPRKLAKPLPSEWEQSLLFWHYSLSPRLAEGLAAMSWLFFWGALAVRRWRALSYTRVAAVMLGIASVALAASAWAKHHPAPLAVASAAKIQVHYANTESSTVRFELQEGDRVALDGVREGDWIHVRTASGEEGWARRAQFTLVGPPYAAAPAQETTP